ncbi:MAG: hypothetical protein HY718_16680 [Planctomycetes bacterium]|nr:hypothetical protein [Planctomycetota bacterium]
MLSSALPPVDGSHRIIGMWLGLGLMWAGIAGEAVGADRGALCADCHQAQGEQLANSVHAAAGIDCRACHGGASSYPVAPAMMNRYRAAAEAAALRVRASESRTASQPYTDRFDHGPDFKGKAARRDIPERCGTCHSDVARMNPYGLATDQWAQYKLSGHGRALYEQGNDRVAVCTDCHGIHEIRQPKDSASSVYPSNIPATCGRCHADPEAMRGSGRSPHVVEEYRDSVHGRGLLEQGDTGMPTCATCHGSHSAIPPGFRDVGHVCGRCHQQEEKHFLESVHAKFDGFPRCVVCHTRRVDLRDHRITKMIGSPDAMEKTAAAVAATMPAATFDDPAALAAFNAKHEPPVERFGLLCQRCHNATRGVGHRMFFGDLDQQAVHRGDEIYSLVRRSELRYGLTARRVNELQRGVLLLKDEAMMLEELRTMVVGLGPLQHTLDPKKIGEAVAAFDAQAAQIDQSLDSKVKALRLRYWALIPMWAFVAVFVGALWTKYQQLKAAMVIHAPSEHGR